MTDKLTFRTNSEEETEHLAQKMAEALFPGAFFALNGDLGAGKTAFVRALARAMGIDDVSSPSFLVVQEYEGPLPLYHFDVYRLSDCDELYDIGFADYQARNGVICMEWPERVFEVLPSERMDIWIAGSGEQEREFTFCAHGEKHRMLLGPLMELKK